MARPALPPALAGARRNGWYLLCHPAFRTPLLKLAADVAALAARGQTGWQDAPRAKLLRRVLDIILTEIPADPASLRYEQGNTLGADARGWRRAKFAGRLRLFFRFDSASKVIVYAWLNDENTLRKSGSATDVYSVFRGMLMGGDPPHDWDRLVDSCRMLSEDAGVISDLLGPVAIVPEPVVVLKGKVSSKKRPRL